MVFKENKQGAERPPANAMPPLRVVFEETARGAVQSQADSVSLRDRVKALEGTKSSAVKDVEGLISNEKASFLVGVAGTCVFGVMTTVACAVYLLNGLSVTILGIVALVGFGFTASFLNTAFGARLRKRKLESLRSKLKGEERE